MNALCRSTSLPPRLVHHNNRYARTILQQIYAYGAPVMETALIAASTIAPQKQRIGRACLMPRPEKHNF